MSRAFRLWEDAQIVNLLEPAADAGGRTSPYVSVANGHKAYVVCHIKQGNAATILLSVLQATDSSGTNSKVLTANVPIVADEDTATSDALVVQSDAKNYTTGAGTTLKIVVFEVDPAKALDINNLTVGPFDCIAVSTGASNAANITSALLVVMPLRNAGSPPPTTTGVS